MRTVSNLFKHDGRIYVYLSSRNIGKLFQQNAENEGFTFGDGVKPTEREFDDIFALKRDWTICYVGWVGHMAFRHPENVVGEPLVRIDYGKYLAGRDDYVM